MYSRLPRLPGYLDSSNWRSSSLCERAYKHSVSGNRRYSEDLPQGGLEIPCCVTFKAKPKEINKLKQVFKRQKHDP